MTWRGRDRRNAPRRWEDEHWTRGEQSKFEAEWQLAMTELAGEVGRLRVAVTRFATVGAVLVVLAPILTAIILGLLSAR